MVKAHVVDDSVTITLSLVQLGLPLNNLGWPPRNKFYPQQYGDQCPGRFLGIIGRDPSVPKINRLCVDIFRFKN